MYSEYCELLGSAGYCVYVHKQYDNRTPKMPVPCWSTELQYLLYGFGVLVQITHYRLNDSRHYWSGNTSTRSYLHF